VCSLLFECSASSSHQLGDIRYSEETGNWTQNGTTGNKGTRAIATTQAKEVHAGILLLPDAAVTSWVTSIFGPEGGSLTGAEPPPVAEIQ